MPIETNYEILSKNGWTFRVQPPNDTILNASVMLMVHGWTGDENVMNIFTSRFPATRWYLAPRGPFPTPEGGYGWHLPQAGRHSSIEDYRPQVESILNWLDQWGKETGIDVSRMDLMGFSQGAAMILALTLLHPERVNRVAALSGFLPSGSDSIAANHWLDGKQILIAHGLRDDVISIDRAHQAVETLQQAGADVEFCTSEVGHKLSAHCMKAVQRFMFSLEP